jgi:hypothetical protein
MEVTLSSEVIELIFLLLKAALFHGTMLLLLAIFW